MRLPAPAKTLGVLACAALLGAAGPAAAGEESSETDAARADSGAEAADTEASDEEPCADQKWPRVIVDTEAHRLHLCRERRAEASYRVAIGQGGTPKRVEGDRKTPLGLYRLGTPRPSVEGYHRFIPIRYPTAEQRREGYTGSAIGIHGPARGFPADEAEANTAVDWTHGCIAVGTDAIVRDVAAWVKRYPNARVDIR